MNRRLLILLAAFALSAAAQDFRANLSGQIKDPSGAGIPNAKITATNTETGVANPTQSTDTGAFNLPAIPPGNYRLDVEHPGFKHYIRNGITLQVQDRANLDITLETGDMQTSISVNADAPLLETASASRGGVITGRTIVDLPLNGRNAFSLASLEPGVTFTARGQASTFLRTTATGGFSSFTFSGGIKQSNESLLDGVPNTGTDGTIQYVPSVDATQEFKIQTNSYDAEYGRFTGGLFNTIIKSGTNSVHGTAFEFVRNSYWNARDPFATSIPQFGYNLFGFSVGGPVELPKLYHGRNRTFWFFNYEGSREGVPRANVNTVPTALQRAGDFSQTRVASGSSGLPVSIYDPATTRLVNGAYVRDAFPGNVIPANRINPLSAKLLALFPLPNAPGNAITNANNDLVSFKDAVSDNGVVLKVDHRFSDRHSIFGRYSWRRFNVGRLGAFQGPVTGDAEHRDAPGIALDDTFVLNPTTVFNFRYGLARFKVGSASDNLGTDLVALGFPASFVSQLPAQAIPQIAISGFTTLSSANKLNRSAENSQSLRAAVNKMTGKHMLKFGAEFRLLDSNAGNLGAAAAGSFNFDQGFTRGPNPQANTVNGGNALASFLLGFPASGSVANVPATADRTTYYGFFFQDDVRVTQRLTLTLGLRYELEGPYVERYNRINRGFDFNAASPIASAAKAAYSASPIPEVPAAQFTVNGGLLFAGVGGQPRSLSNLDSNNIAPRLGFAFQITPKTVIRGGYGMFYGAGTLSAESRNGFSVTSTYVASNDGGLTPVNNGLSNPFPTPLLVPTGASGGLGTLVGEGFSFTSVNRAQPLAQQYSFSIQRELMKNLLAEVSYVGAMDRDIAVNVARDGIPETFRAAAEQTFQATGRNTLNDSVNNPFFGLISSGALSSKTTTRGQLLRPYPEFTSLTELSVPIGSSRYDSFQVKVTRRFANSFNLTSSYSFSKQLDQIRYLNDQDPKLTKELDDSDIPQRFVASGLYELPFGPGKRFLGKSHGFAARLSEGMQINVLYQAQSGVPFDISGAVSTGVTAKLDDPTVSRWFNTSAFRIRQTNELVKTTRLPDVRSAGKNNFDVSFFKNTQLSEAIKLQFRAEAFNVLNRPEWSSPGTAFGSANFGVVTSTNTFARQLQFALKLLW